MLRSCGVIGKNDCPTGKTQGNQNSNKYFQHHMNNFLHLHKSQCIYSAASMVRHQDYWENKILIRSNNCNIFQFDGPE